MLKTICHCESLVLESPELPEFVVSCNCSICRRYGALWAYYRGDQVSVRDREATQSTYQWGDNKLVFHFCSSCSCIMYHSATGIDGGSRIGINTRMANPQIPDSIPVRLFDGADTWQYIDE